MREMTTAFLSALCILSGLSYPVVSCAQDYPASVVELVARTRAQVTTMGMTEFKSAFDRGALGLIVDVREPSEFAQGHIPGAINIPRGQIEIRIWSHVGYPDRTDLGRRITLYCRSGTRSVLSAKSLQDLGFHNVVAADILLDEWAKAGNPLVKE